MEDKIGMAIHFDGVHIITVNFSRKEAKLFENGGSQTGTLIFKKDEAAAKASIDDPMKLIDMALSFGVSYELLARVASPHSMKVFETLGVKAFLDKVVDLTTETERHQRFEGFEFSFGNSNGSNGSSKPAPPTNPANGRSAPVDETDATTKRKGAKAPT
ncbi:MAG: hypothetical protein LCI00_19250 [Chloroflexi bacterium]|nr:hypothetical protein [Chloroflexota bacterium]MCC6894140.1 hypothetical protein [Anaerolineae bacterium]